LEDVGGIGYVLGEKEEREKEKKEQKKPLDFLLLFSLLSFCLSSSHRCHPPSLSEKKGHG